MNCFDARAIRLFIDRDPSHFAILLNFLRSGELFVPDDLAMKRLLQDAEFYGVSLKKVISDKKKRDKQRTAASTEVRLIALRFLLHFHRCLPLFLSNARCCSF